MSEKERFGRSEQGEQSDVEELFDEAVGWNEAIEAIYQVMVHLGERSGGRGRGPVRAERLLKVFYESGQPWVPTDSIDERFNDKYSGTKARAALNKWLEEIGSGLEIVDTRISYIRRKSTDT